MGRRGPPPPQPTRLKLLARQPRQAPDQHPRAAAPLARRCGRTSWSVRRRSNGTALSTHEPPEPPVDSLPGREVVGQHPPAAARPGKVALRELALAGTVARPLRVVERQHAAGPQQRLVERELRSACGKTCLFIKQTTAIAHTFLGP
jgi:hypothetical protein